MVKDFNLDIKISMVSTVRDKYGLALSSRNKLLNIKDLKIARNIFKNLKKLNNKKIYQT